MLLKVLSVLVALWASPAMASLPDATPVTGEHASKKKKDEPNSEEKSEEQKRAEAEAERKRKEKLARVILLKWPETSTDYTNETVMRNVRSRISRPEGMFFPEIDLYQNGRKVPDRTVIPAMQPAVVPDSNIPGVLAAVDQTLATPWNALHPSQWGSKAQELRAMSEQLWFIDRVELREPLFLLYAAIGYAAENQNHPAPPFYEQIGSMPVNYYWYLAAQLAYQEPSLMSKLTDQDLSGSIGYQLNQLQQGVYPSFKVDFEQENFYDEEQFNKDYEILVNGIAVELDGNAQLDVFLGRTDIYLKRKDTGHGLTERLEVIKLADKFYFIRDVARKRMGLDFIDQLFHHRNECNPEVDGDILNYLAIYQKMHEKAEVYVAVPEFGNPNKVWIWRYDRKSAQLSAVGGGPDGFPVRFALLFSSGVLYNGAAVDIDTDVSDESSVAPEDLANPRRISKDLASAMVPFDFELRMHYNRLMVNFGAEFGYNVARDSKGWVEYYQTPGKQKEDKDVNEISTTRNDCRPIYDLASEDGGELDSFSGEPRYECSQFQEVYNERTFNRDLYMGVGVVLGRDAGIGFGPRFAAQWGWTNIPHGWQTTAHFGWAIQPPIGDFGGRFRPMVDLDLRGGIAIARHRSLQREIAAASTTDRQKNVMPVFGLNLGIGFTF